MPPSEFAYAAIVAMAKAVNDRYTQFFTPTEFKAFNEALDPARIGGIGVMIEPDTTTGYVRLTYVLPSTPAERAGLQVGDLVMSVNGTPTKGLAVDAVQRAVARPGRHRRVRDPLPRECARRSSRSRATTCSRRP